MQGEFSTHAQQNKTTQPFSLPVSTGMRFLIYPRTVANISHNSNVYNHNQKSQNDRNQ